MSIDLKTLGIDRLSVKERLELIDQIWNTLPPQEVAPENIAPEVMEELKRRWEEAEANPGEGRPYEEVLEELRNRHK